MNYNYFIGTKLQGEDEKRITLEEIKKLTGNRYKEALIELHNEEVGLWMIYPQVIWAEEA